MLGIPSEMRPPVSTGVDHRVPSPAWWKFETDGARERLLAAALPGRSLRSWAEEVEPPTQVVLQAAALRAVHDTLPVPTSIVEFIS